MELLRRDVWPETLVGFLQDGLVGRLRKKCANHRPFEPTSLRRSNRRQEIDKIFRVHMASQKETWKRLFIGIYYGIFMQNTKLLLKQIREKMIVVIETYGHSANACPIEKQYLTIDALKRINARNRTISQ
jgi:hypothetical protein